MKAPKRRFHVAIIMDGNGRYASERGLPRLAGHKLGADALRTTVEAAPVLGITDLTLYAFSSDNWKRPADEVEHLMGLLESYLESERPRLIERDIRLSVIGRKDRLPAHLPALIRVAELATASCKRLHVRLAIDYSSRDALVRAAQLLRSRSEIARNDVADCLPAPDVDLLIRTGGEQRLSDFLLWESAYAELVFLTCKWPEFDRGHLERAVTAFSQRDRRFGSAPAA